MQARVYQQNIINNIRQAWTEGHQNVLVQLATGGGKTFIFSRIIAEHDGYSVAIAHRVELISQISLALAREGVRHALLSSRTSVRDIITLHMQEFGVSYYDPNARVIVAGVDTLVRMSAPWFARVTLVVQDEAHHVLRSNKWGKAAELFANAHGLYPTATPARADGRGLGRKADGIIDHMVVGVSMADLIREGYLTKYRIFAPQCDIDLMHVPVTAAGDYSPKPLRDAVHKSHITGDIVSHYLRLARGKLGVTFAVDIESATAIAAEFRTSGVPAAVITGKTPDLERAAIMRRFRNRELLQLVNVDLLGEGVDVPALECVSFGRPTQSYSLYVQQFGRALRPMPGKEHAIIIDHVGNVLRHGLPDAPRVWSLERRDRRARTSPSDVEPIRTCPLPDCLFVYSRLLRACPHCGHVYTPAVRSSPELVDGDLLELDADILARLRGEIALIDAPARVPFGASDVVRHTRVKRHREKQATQADLRETIAQWAGVWHARGAGDSEIYKRFFYTFGIDILTAQTLGVAQALELIDTITLQNNRE